MVPRCVRLGAPYDLRRSLLQLRRGMGDPTMRLDVDRGERATRTPDGPASLRLTQTADDRVEVEAWGPGRDWAVEHAPALLGAEDVPQQLLPRHGLVRTLHAQFSGMRITRSRATFEALVPSILEQKVIGADARQSYARLVRRLGESAPGDLGLLLPPTAQTWGETAYPVFHQCGVERRRAEVIRHAARRQSRIDECVELPLADAHLRLQALSGVGPWTAAEVAIIALGDADAVSLGDFHLPNTVAWALAGEPRGTDERMLELLEPYRGQRGRVIRYLGLGGVVAPRYGPRLARQDISRV